MLCSKCGQATVNGTAWGISFNPCSCPIDEEAEEKRYESIKKRIDDAYARLGADGVTERELCH